MGMLADWFIQIRTEGADKAKQDAAGVKGSLDAGEKSAGMMGKAIAGAAKALGPIAIAMALIHKGLETEQGDAMMEVLSQIGDILARLIAPFMGLVASILARWVPILEKVVGVLAPIIDLVVQLADVFATVGTAIVSYLLAPLEQLAKMVADLLGVSINFDPAKKKKDDKKAGIEDPTAVFKRIQENVAGGGIEKEKLAALKDIRKFSASMDERIAKLKPAVG